MKTLLTFFSIVALVLGGSITMMMTPHVNTKVVEFVLAFIGTMMVGGGLWEFYSWELLKKVGE